MARRLMLIIRYWNWLTYIQHIYTAHNIHIKIIFFYVKHKKYSNTDQDLIDDLLNMYELNIFFPLSLN